MFLIQRQKYSKGDKQLGILQTSGASLAKELGLTIYTPIIKPRKHLNRLTLNWGCSHINWLEDEKVTFNKPSKVAISSDKIKAFSSMSCGDVRVVPYTTIRLEAENWFDCGNDRTKVVCRTVVNGSSGAGIVIAKSKDELVDCKLYTLYIEKKWEYRVHVVLGGIIHIQQKRKLSSEQLEIKGISNRSKYIRNLANGYIFSTELYHHSDEFILEELYSQSIKAIKAIGLDFGAVDLLVTKDNDVFVLEVNSAPGLEGITLSKYISRFKEILGL